MLEEFVANVRQPAHQGFVDPKNDQQNTAGEAGRDRTDARQQALEQTHDPSDDRVAGGMDQQFFLLFRQEGFIVYGIIVFCHIFFYSLIFFHHSTTKAEILL